MDSKNTGMRYICPQCGHLMATAHPRPNHAWTVRRDPELWHRCEACACFAIPEELLKFGEPLSRDVFWMFSSCPNAYECSLHDQYGADCEEGRVMQKCFVALHTGLDIANHALSELTEPARRARREAAEKSFPKDGLRVSPKRFE